MVKGYKIFNPDWTCKPTGGFKQYSCPGRFQQDGELDVCGNGMHFCLNPADCFNYYSFDSSNKVAEVIAHGEVIQDGDKCCTDDLDIVREISWQEVLTLVNTGKDCTGLCNTGNRNAGNRNAGNRNAGNRNAGNWNAGNRNAGNWNTGDCNTGNRNTGNWNTGNWNTGNCNTGDCNAGNWNTGDCNTGDCNAGNRNAGNRNTGNWNTGDCNTGDWNKSSFNTGCFNTEEQKIMLFNEPSNWTYKDWLNSGARRLLNEIPRNVVEWIYESDMTDEEKATHPEAKTTGGYLKILDESECAQIWWDRLNDKEKKIIRSIPNFDPDIFRQCTGIKVV